MPKPTLLNVITKKPCRDRIIRRGFAGRPTADELADERTIDPEGGSQGAGIIRGASLIAKGEALGHDFWIDDVALDQVAELGNTETGLKVRFTHPSMSGDGLGSYLGRAKNLSRDGDQVFGDVHFSPTSRGENPGGEGDRGGYVLALADDDPEAFGMSIVFDHDFPAEAQFVHDNEEFEDDDTRGHFVSPDSDNVENFAHVRLAALHGADFVDTPAANPSGLFHIGPTADILKQADGVLAYALGLSEELPEDAGGLSPERFRGFLSRFLDSRGLALSLIEREEPMSKKTDDALENKTTDEASTVDESKETELSKPDEKKPEAKPAETFSKADLAKYVEKFGAEKGTAFFLEGTSFEDALSGEFDRLKKEKKLGVGESRGEDKPAETFTGGKVNTRQPKSVAGFQSLVRINGQTPASVESN